MTEKFKYNIGQKVYTSCFISSRVSAKEIHVREENVLGHVDRGRGPEYLLEDRDLSDIWPEHCLFPTSASAKALLLEQAIRDLSKKLAGAEMELAKLKEEDKQK